MELQLHNKLALFMILCGGIFFILAFGTFWSVAAILIMAGGFVIFLIYYEKPWIEKKYLKRGLIFTLLFAIVYGILEYVFFDATWNYWFKISAWFPSKYLYWVFMAVLNFSLVFIISKKSIALGFLSVPLFSVNEDLWYWITKSIHNGIYVFPVPNWFDQRFPVYGLGEPIPFFPFWPRFYFVLWTLITILLFIQFKDLENKKLLISVCIFCGTSFIFLLLIPQSFSKLTSNLFYFFHNIQHKIIFI
ncbi:MAG: hypothetical protein HWN67_05220 [Candidatus Helarchaeota archaeon]|nr:hypothetical protein [Candidatus Helarchaeota archaeon]